MFTQVLKYLSAGCVLSLLSTFSGSAYGWTHIAGYGTPPIHQLGYATVWTAFTVTASDLYARDAAIWASYGYKNGSLNQEAHTRDTSPMADDCFFTGTPATAGTYRIVDIITFEYQEWWDAPYWMWVTMNDPPEGDEKDTSSHYLTFQ